MKKFAFLFVFALAGSLFLASCSGGDDDDTTTKPRPSINWKGGGTYTSANTDVAAGNSIDFGINASATDGNITRVRVTVNVNGAGALILADSTLKEKTVNIDWLGVNVGNLPNSKAVYTATATQSNGESSSVTFTVTVTATPKNVQTRPNIEMGGQTNSTLGSFFNYSTQQVLLLGDANQAPADVDFIYYSGATNGLTFAAPNNTDVTQIFSSVSSWTPRNNTKFRRTTLTAAEFDAIMDGTPSTKIDDEATSGVFGSDVKQLKVGDVIVFITAGGQEFGLLKVTAVTAGGAGKITFDLKFGS